MHILTQRCLVREFQESDILDFMVYRNDAQWMQYQEFKCLSKEEYSEKLLSNHDLTAGVQYAIICNQTETLIGDIFLQQTSSVFWIGYSINPSWARKGYMYEVLQTIINWVGNHGGKVIRAGVLAENIPSIRLLQKLNFTYTMADPDGEQIYSLDLREKLADNPPHPVSD